MANPFWMVPIMPPDVRLAGQSKSIIEPSAVSRERSVLNLSRLIAYCGNHLEEGLNLATFVT